MNRVMTFLTGRLGVFRTWSSFGRVAAWVVVWVLLIGAVLGPAGPGLGRDAGADVPPSRRVEYLGASSLRDYAGFVRPTTHGDEGVFRVAWIGGSELKLNAVSVPGVVSLAMESFGGRPIEHDVYNLVAPRIVDVARAAESAVDIRPDAIVVSLAPVWMVDEFQLLTWTNLDVANLGTLWHDPATWPYALAFTSPGDVAWRATRAWSTAVDDQFPRNARQRELIDALDVLARPADPPAADPGDPRLPSNPIDFWLLHERGPDAIGSVTERAAAMMDGLHPTQEVATEWAERFVRTLAEPGVPVYLYVPPFSPEARADPHFAAALARMVAFWRAVDDAVEAPNVHIEVDDLGAEFADRAVFGDLIHQHDATPFADVLAPRLCLWWMERYPGEECV